MVDHAPLTVMANYAGAIMKSAVLIKDLYLALIQEWAILQL